MRESRRAAAIAAAAIAVTGVSSAFAISRVVSANAPHTIAFTLGTAHRDLTYCNGQTLDLYVPRPASSGPLPVAVYIHGGGMTAGDKTNLDPAFLNPLARAGYAVASVNYRLAPQFKFPVQIEDVKCAIRYLRTNAGTYGLNGTEMFAFGTSSGGQLVALAALTGPSSMFDVGAYPAVPSSVTAVVDLFGPANLTEGTSGYSTSEIAQVFGDSQVAALASPTHWVTANAPPILLVHGVEDMTVPESQSVELDNDLRAAGTQSDLVLVQNMGHMFVQAGARPMDPSMGQIAQDLVGFFDAHRSGA